MVAGIDDWLFRLADLRDCEPNEDDCKKCDNKSCPYWADEHEANDD